MPHLLHVVRRGSAGGQAIGGSKDKDSVAVWSRDDLVPVGFCGYRLHEYALERFLKSCSHAGYAEQPGSARMPRPTESL